jgi:hypothetical protein
MKPPSPTPIGVAALFSDLNSPLLADLTTKLPCDSRPREFCYPLYCLEKLSNQYISTFPRKRGLVKTMS